MNTSGPLSDADEVTVHAVSIKKKIKGEVLGTDGNGVFLKVTDTGSSVFFPWTSITYISYKKA